MLKRQHIITFKQNKGFTLLEALTVIALLGILTALILPRLDFSNRTGSDATAQSTLDTFANYETQIVWPSKGAQIDPTAPAYVCSIAGLNGIKTTASTAACSGGATSSCNSSSCPTTSDSGTVPSSNSKEISVYIVANKIGYAVLSKNTCWLMSYAPTNGINTTATVYGYADVSANKTKCTGLGAYQVLGSSPSANTSPVQAGKGTSWLNPYQANLS